MFYKMLSLKKSIYKVCPIRHQDLSRPTPTFSPGLIFPKISKFCIYVSRTIIASRRNFHLKITKIHLATKLFAFQSVGRDIYDISLLVKLIFKWGLKSTTILFKFLLALCLLIILICFIGIYVMHS